MASIIKSAANMGKSITGDITKAVITLGYTDTSNKITLKLPYNPSSLTFRAIAGTGNAIVGNSETLYNEVDPRIEFSFTVFVEEVNVSDAFLYEGSSLSTVTSTIKTIANLVTGSSYSVAAYVEGLLTAMHTEPYSQVMFQLGNLNYEGTLSAVNARYTMFNTSGDPIKAEMDIRVVCLSQETRNMRTIWATKYTNAVKNLGGESASSADLGTKTVASSLGGYITKKISG